MVAVQKQIAVGVAGWSYPDWNGYVYPPGTRDQLRFLAAYVDVVEINSTFYRPPGAGMCTSWLKRTRETPDLLFTAKLHQDVTHGGIVAEEMVRDFHEGLAPLATAGRLRHLLAQFRYDFADSPASREHIEKIRDAFGDIAQLTLELRHNSWEAPDALEFLRPLGVTVAALDYPVAANSFKLDHSGVGQNAYLRLHGRNAKAWFSSGAGRNETYNYLYSSAELEGIKRRAIRIAGMSATLTVIANNHYQGKEMANALQLKSMLSGKKVPVPALLKSKYPDLSAIAAEEPSGGGELRLG